MADQDPTLLLLPGLSLDGASSSSSSEPEEAANPQTTTNNNTEPKSKVQSRADRSALSEEAFQHLKSTYVPKVENGEIWTKFTFNTKTPFTKPEREELMHAVEELYFFHRYAEAVHILDKIFEDDGEERLDRETKSTLRHYQVKCLARLEKQAAATSSASPAAAAAAATEQVAVLVADK
ncbi:hypothetical protein QBC35DRAFT_487352 [Podospora australis]|uniref:Uncharacterized protein n=1 Tax=Podospora australis TaxID=1536484 RepID=A0AAN6X092_9PEZI|nr:hypothetical protein QBC35DRAFT_487352 [Podospora australis]